MAKKKLVRIRELPLFSNVVQDPFSWQGRWHRDYFHNDVPITLEIGCGKADFMVAMAQRAPDQSFIGLDLKAARLWVGAKNALTHQLQNIALIHDNAARLTDMFGPEEIAEIWLTFPDPYPQKPRKRLISPAFLSRYRQILHQDGLIHLKTDSEALFRWALFVIQREHCTLVKKVDNLDEVPDCEAELKIQTTYEQRHRALGQTIRYLCFSLDRCGTMMQQNSTNGMILANHQLKDLNYHFDIDQSLWDSHEK